MTRAEQIIHEVRDSTSYGPSSVTIISKPNYVAWFALAVIALGILDVIYHLVW